MVTRQGPPQTIRTLNMARAIAATNSDRYRYGDDQSYCDGFNAGFDLGFEAGQIAATPTDVAAGDLIPEKEANTPTVANSSTI